MRDFFLSAYHQLLEALKAEQYVFYRFADRPFLHNPHQYHVMLRHDVDRLPSRALRMAEVEAEKGIVSTYFFRTKPASFNRGVIENIKNMGHEIGYHYECLSDTRGDTDKAWRLFQKEMEKFSDLCKVKSIAMHGRPFSSYDNRALWNKHDYTNAGIILEAYLDIPWERYLYFTDVGGKWNNDNNLRDYVPSSGSQPSDVKTTMDLINKLRHIHKSNLVISTHPERWPSSIIGWAQSRMTDSAADIVKSMLMLFRK